MLLFKLFKFPIFWKDFSELNSVCEFWIFPLWKFGFQGNSGGALCLASTQLPCFHFISHNKVGKRDRSTLHFEKLKVFFSLKKTVQIVFKTISKIIPTLPWYVKSVFNFISMHSINIRKVKNNLKNLIGHLKT